MTYQALSTSGLRLLILMALLVYPTGSGWSQEQWRANDPCPELPDGRACTHPTGCSRPNQCVCNELGQLVGQRRELSRNTYVILKYYDDEGLLSGDDFIECEAGRISRSVGIRTSYQHLAAITMMSSDSNIDGTVDVEVWELPIRVGLAPIELSGRAADRHLRRGDMGNFSAVLRAMLRADQKRTTDLSSQTLERVRGCWETPSSCSGAPFDYVVLPTLSRNSENDFTIEVEVLSQQGCLVTASAPSGSRVELDELYEVGAYVIAGLRECPLEPPEPPVVAETAPLSAPPPSPSPAANSAPPQPTRTGESLRAQRTAVVVVFAVFLLLGLVPALLKFHRWARERKLKTRLYVVGDTRVSAADLFWDLGGHRLAFRLLLRHGLIPGNRSEVHQCRRRLEALVEEYGSYRNFCRVRGDAAFQWYEDHGSRSNAPLPEDLGDAKVDTYYSEGSRLDYWNTPHRGVVAELLTPGRTGCSAWSRTSTKSATISQYVRRLGQLPSASLEQVASAASMRKTHAVTVVAGAGLGIEAGFEAFGSLQKGAEVGEAILDFGDVEGGDLLFTAAFALTAALLSGKLLSGVSKWWKSRRLRQLVKTAGEYLENLYVLYATPGPVSRKMISNLATLQPVTGTVYEEIRVLRAETSKLTNNKGARHLTKLLFEEVRRIDRRTRGDANRMSARINNIASSKKKVDAGIHIFACRSIICWNVPEVEPLLQKIAESMQQLEQERQRLVDKGVLAQPSH